MEKKIYRSILLFLAMAGSTWAQSTSCFNYVVAQDGTGNFTTVQAAFNAVPANSATRTTIYVKNGTYQEPLTLASNKINISLIGQSETGVVLTYNRSAQTVNPSTGVTFGTSGSSSTYINAAGFYANNVTFQNSSTTAHDPALAIYINGDKAVFVNCQFLGPDDTIYGDRCRQYFQGCYIRGNTDFIFGPSTAVFQNCELHSHGGTALTAASTENYVTYGYVFLGCKVTADAGVKTDLGRPWRQYAAVAYLNCDLGGVINAGGWDDWNNTANDATVRFAEYQNTNTSTANRVPYDQLLTAAQAAPYNTLNVLKTTYANPPGTDNWDPSVVINGTVTVCGPTPTFTRTPTAPPTRTSTPTATRTSTPASVSSYARGSDVGWLSQMESQGRTFRDNAGVTIGALSVLQEKCINAIRLRVWVNPAGGWCGKTDVVNMATRAKAMGYRIMIDFHYSDSWADPGKQNKPAAWASFTFAQLQQAVSQHTNDVLTALSAAGVQPEWVQVGNETNDGMLWPANTGDPGGKASVNGFTSFAQLINSGYSATKAVFPNAKVVIHISNGYDNALFRWMFDGLKAAGANWDVIGMSLYPSTANWATLDTQCQTNSNDMITRYGKPVIMSEVGMDVSDPTNSFNFLTDILAKNQGLPGGNGLGVFYWEPEAYNWMGYSLVAFDNTGMPTHAMDAFGNGCSLPTPTKTNTPTVTKTFTPTATRTSTPSPTVSNTPTRTFTSSWTASSTATRTNTPVPPTNTFTSTATRTSTPTSTNTASSTPTASRTPTASATSTPTSTNTSTFTNTATSTFTWTNTPIPPSATPSWTNTSSSTPTRTTTFTNTWTNSSTATRTSTPTSTNMSTFTNTATSTFTRTDTPVLPTNTFTLTASPSSTPSGTSTASSTATSTSTPTNTNSPVPPSSTPTRTFTATSTNTSTNSPVPPTKTFTATSTDSATPTNSPVPPSATATKTSTATSTATSTNTAVPPTATFTNTNSPVPPTATPTRTFTATSTNTSTDTAIPPSATPSRTNTPSSTSTGTATFTRTATATPTNSLTATHTLSPTATNTPSRTPTAPATSTPTGTPTPTFTFTATASSTSTVTTTPTAVTGGIQAVIYPNPVTGNSFSIQVTGMTTMDKVQVQVETTAFRVVNQLTFHSQGPGTATLTVPATDSTGVLLANGVYYVIVRTQGSRITLKLLVMR